MNGNSLAKRLKMLRESRKLRLQDIAEVLGIPKTTYAHYEKEESEPKISSIVKLSQFYGISVDWLLGANEYAKSPPPEDRWESIRKTLETFPEKDFQEVLSFLKFIEWRINERNK